MLFASNKKNVVIFDRYIYDFYTELYYIKNRIGFMRFVMKIAPKPDYIFYLNIPPEVVFNRKQDLSIEEITIVQNRTRELLSHLDNFKLLDMSESPEKITNKVISIAFH